MEKGTGASVDQAFLEEMARHHQMALDMIAKAKLKDPDLRKLSQNMEDGQKRELQELKRLQAAKWGGAIPAHVMESPAMRSMK